MKVQGAGVPTWSWMAVTGGIDYFRPPFNGCSWADVRSQSRDSKRSLDHDVIAAVAHEYRIELARNGEDHIRFDDPLHPERERAKVVVLGIRNEPGKLEDRVHYVLVVALESEVTLSVPLYRRIGAGHLPKKYLGNTIGNIHITSTQTKKQAQ
ncbi:hypothetical protein J1614_003340 [Plenodomus biglobosus]|nr:hypothetical protein J1614_003340 [Plenodomus biglobosus]